MFYVLNFFSKHIIDIFTLMLAIIAFIVVLVLSLVSIFFSHRNRQLKQGSDVDKPIGEQIRETLFDMTDPEIEEIPQDSKLNTHQDSSIKSILKHSCSIERQPRLISINEIIDLYGNTIYISDLTTANCPNMLRKYHIKATLNCSYHHYDPSDVLNDYIEIDMYDSEGQNIMQYFDKAHAFIDKNIKKGNVLVHCAAGISRSVTLVISYLMKKGYSYVDALTLVQKKRRIAKPNEGFIRQLVKYEMELKKK